jgi:hypothetical protein
MRPVLLSLLLLAACPKQGAETSGSVGPSPTPAERSYDPPSEGTEARGDTPPPDAAQRVLTAVVVRAEGSDAPVPAGLEVVRGDGDVLAVRGNPRAMPTRGDWTTAAVLGDASEAAKVRDLPALMALLADEVDLVAARVTLAADAPEDAADQLRALRIDVDAATGRTLRIDVIPSRLARLLGVVWVESFELAPPQ